MIWRSWVQTSSRANLGCRVLLNQKKKTLHKHRTYTAQWLQLVFDFHRKNIQKWHTIKLYSTLFHNRLNQTLTLLQNSLHVPICLPSKHVTFSGSDWFTPSGYGRSTPNTHQCPGAQSPGGRRSSVKSISQIMHELEILVYHYSLLLFPISVDKANDFTHYVQIVFVEHDSTWFQNINVHAYSPDIPMSLANCTITHLALEHIPLWSPPMGRIQPTIANHDNINIFHSSRCPVLLGEQRQYGMRSSPDASIHDQQ